VTEYAKLPRWKVCLEDMLKKGVEYGQTWKTSYFEESLGSKLKTMEFQLGISSIRAALLEHGMYLSGRGTRGKSFVILNPEANAEVMSSYQKEAAKALKKGVVLGTNTDLGLLDSDDRRRHEAVLERIAIRQALIGRRTADLKRIIKPKKKKQD
jgi:hypothetical protein